MIVFTMQNTFCLNRSSEQTQTAIITKCQNMSLKHAIVSNVVQKKGLLDFVSDFFALFQEI